MIFAEERKYCIIALLERLDGDVYIQNQTATEMDSTACVVLHPRVRSSASVEQDVTTSNIFILVLITVDEHVYFIFNKL